MFLFGITQWHPCTCWHLQLIQKYKAQRHTVILKDTPDPFSQFFHLLLEGYVSYLAYMY